MFALGRKPSPHRHWHVNAGITYATECVGSYRTIGDARHELRWQRAGFEDIKYQGENPRAYRITGSVRGGQVSIQATDPGSVWERTAYIAECDNPECAPDVFPEYD